MDNNTQELLNAGSDILKSVTKAIDTNDYSKLASEISRTVKAVNIERRTIYASGNNQDRTVHIVMGNDSKEKTKAFSTFPFLAKRISKYNGLVSGIIGTSLSFCFFWAFFGCLFSHILPLIITMLAITIITGLWGFSGFKKFKLAKEMHKYGNILKNAEFFKVSDLASAALESDEQVYKNLKDMVAAGYVPRGKFDATNTTFMITDAAYQMYLGAEQDRLARERREAQVQDLTRSAAPAKAPDKVQSLLDEGKEYITFVRQINDVIPDTEEMSNKLYKLESIMNKIFDQVKKNPETADDLHKLMNYYLPTTKKLLAAYVELDKQAGNGENVQQTKNEIDAVMDTINDAFEKLLDSLFQDMAWDISSDISVMKTMMAQDGLTDDGMQVATAGGMMAQAQQGAVLEFDK